ncbi:MAG: phosphatidylglycerophosphatase A family protein [Alphaproteobacteria bacterium]
MVKKVASSFNDLLAKWLATGLGMGYVPIGSGTVASFAVAIMFYMLTTMSLLPQELFLIWLLWLFLIMVIGFWATAYYLKKRVVIGKNDPKPNDPSEVVIDEVIGQTIALLPMTLFFSNMTLERNISLIVLSFLLFRLFDIWKPGAIGKLDRNNKKAKHSNYYIRATMVMIDDIYAGLYAAGIISIIIVIDFFFIF